MHRRMRTLYRKRRIYERRKTRLKQAIYRSSIPKLPLASAGRPRSCRLVKVALPRSNPDVSKLTVVGDYSVYTACARWPGGRTKTEKLLIGEMTMKTRHSFVLTVLLFSGAAPAMANSVFQDGPGELGYTVQPDHARGNKTRAQVQQELDAAKADKRGPYYRFQYSMPQPPLPATTGSSTNEASPGGTGTSAAERQRLNELYGGA